jgi:hypothetical protein
MFIDREDQKAVVSIDCVCIGTFKIECCPICGDKLGEE